MDYIQNLNNLKSLVKNRILTYYDFIDYIDIPKTFDDIEKLHIYLIDAVMKIHSNEVSNINTRLSNNSPNSKICLKQCEDAKSGNKIYFFNNDSFSYYIFGDIHADSVTPLAFIKKLDFIQNAQNQKNIRLIFLGDYVDRGKAVYKTLEILLTLKLLFPEQVFLLRGNHDGGYIISENEYKLCVGRNINTTDDDYFVASLFNKLKSLHKPLDMLESYLNLFRELNHIALINNDNETIMCVHGGIPRPKNDDYQHLNALSDLCDVDIVDELNGNVIHNMLWSDPASNDILQSTTRRFYYYKNDFDNFTRKFSIDKIIRGHQAFNTGVKFFFDNKLISIFSSGIVNSKNYNKETAYYDITPCLLYLYNGKISIIRLDK